MLTNKLTNADKNITSLAEVMEGCDWYTPVAKITRTVTEWSPRIKALRTGYRTALRINDIFLQFLPSDRRLSKTEMLRRFKYAVFFCAVVAICSPQCVNGGQCVSPNFCLCLPGTYGAACEKCMSTLLCTLCFKRWRARVCQRVGLNRILCSTEERSWYLVRPPGRRNWFNSHIGLSGNRTRIPHCRHFV